MTNDNIKRAAADLGPGLVPAQANDLAEAIAPYTDLLQAVLEALNAIDERLANIEKNTRVVRASKGSRR